MAEAVRLGEMVACAERELWMMRNTCALMKQAGQVTADQERDVILMADIVAYLRRDLGAP